MKQILQGIKMKKFFITFFILMISTIPAFSENIDAIINKSEISKNATVSVSLRKLNSGNVVYEKDSKKLLHPASTLKAFTTPVIANQLGSNYKFKTQIYKTKDNDVYLKLSGNPALTSKDLRSLITSLYGAGIKEINHFYIDDSIMDNQEYGTGWMWDDEILTYIPKYSRYNIDENIFSITVKPSLENKNINIETPKNYNVIVENKLKLGTKNNIIVERNFWEGMEKITLLGSVKTNEVIKVPVFNPKKYFISAIQDIINTSNISYYGTYGNKIVPADAILVKEIETSVEGFYPLIMKNSNNMITETLFKISGGKYKQLQGKTSYAIEAFNDYYKNIGVSVDDIIIADGSGVSRNDLISTNWMTEALYKINKNDKYYNYKEYFNIPNEGTMLNRLFDLRDFLWTKTGTLSNISGLTGYIKSKNGNEYAFAILIQNTNKPISEAKKLEDEIIKTIYNKY